MGSLGGLYATQGKRAPPLHGLGPLMREVNMQSVMKALRAPTHLLEEGPLLTFLYRSAHRHSWALLNLGTKSYSCVDFVAQFIVDSLTHP